MAENNSGMTGTTGSTGSGSNTGSRMSGSSSSEGIQGVLRKLGIDETLINGMIDNWRKQLTDTVTSTIQETELRDAFDKVRHVMGGSAETVKTYSARNPKLFYSGVTAVMIGAGLIAAAARDAAGDTEVDVSSTTNDRGL
jgi:hypothetical protein